MSQYVAGSYLITYNGVSIGQTSEGIAIHTASYKEIITGDQLGRAAQDAVYQGTDVTSDFILMEWNLQSSMLAMWPYSSNNDGNLINAGIPINSFLTAGVVGRMDVQQGLVSSLNLTAIQGPPARQLQAPTTITLQQSILHEDFPVDHIFATKHRKVPIRMRHYPRFLNPNPNSGLPDYSAVYGSITQTSP